MIQIARIKSLDARNREYIAGMRERRERRLAARNGHKEAQQTKRVTVVVPKIRTDADFDNLIRNFKV